MSRRCTVARGRAAGARGLGGGPALTPKPLEPRPCRVRIFPGFARRHVGHASPIGGMLVTRLDSLSYYSHVTKRQEPCYTFDL